MASAALLAAAVMAAGRGHPTPGRVAPAPGSQQPQRRGPRTLGVGGRRLAAVSVGIATALVVGGPVGVAAGALAAVGLARALGRLRSVHDERRVAAIRAGLPLAADLMAATLAAGAPVATAARGVGEALAGPLGAELVRAGQALELGAPPAAAWGPLLRDDAVAGLARPLVRATTRGSPPATALAVAAEELRREARDRTAAAAEVAGVRAVGPLGACFLPAFVLLGVVPLVVGLSSALLDQV